MPAEDRNYIVGCDLPGYLINAHCLCMMTLPQPHDRDMHVGATLY